MTKKFSSHFHRTNLERLFTEKISQVSSKGLDKKTVEAFAKEKEKELGIIEKKVLNHSYMLTPYLELLVLKGRNKLPRMISIPTIRDRVFIESLKEILYEHFKNSVKKQMPNSYIRRIKDFIKEAKTDKIYFLKTDIEKFFDNVEWPFLLKEISAKIKDDEVVSLVEKTIKCPTVPATYQKKDIKKYYSVKGVPQGLSISNVLAQIYIDKIDKYFEERLKSSLYLRYIDDILIISKNNCKNFKRTLSKKLETIKLGLNEDKTHLSSLEEGLDFLGYELDLNKVRPAKKNIENLTKRLAGKFTWFKTGVDNRELRPTWLEDDKRYKEVFIEELNEIITGSIGEQKNYGWLYYYVEINDLLTLYKLDNIVAKMFRRLESFDRKAPKNLKKFSRAYHEIKYNKGGNYVNNYDLLNTIGKKRTFLVRRGQLNPSVGYTTLQIELKFKSYMMKNLVDLDEDVRYN